MERRAVRRAAPADRSPRSPSRLPTSLGSQPRRGEPTSDARGPARHDRRHEPRCPPGARSGRSCAIIPRRCRATGSSLPARWRRGLRPRPRCRPRLRQKAVGCRNRVPNSVPLASFRQVASPRRDRACGCGRGRWWRACDPTSPGRRHRARAFPLRRTSPRRPLPSVRGADRLSAAGLFESGERCPAHACGPKGASAP